MTAVDDAGSRLLLLLRATAALGIVVPALLAYNVPPSATFLNQAAALIGWGGFFAVLAGSLRPAPALQSGAGTNSLLAAYGLVLIGVLASAMFAGLPAPLALSSAGMLLAALLATAVGAAAAGSVTHKAAFRAFCEGLVWAGVLSCAVALIQSFAPQWADGRWIANAATPGRVGGNLRQPNHLSSLLVLSAIALVWLREQSPDVLMRRLTAVLMPLFILGIVLTASRTGAICVALLAAWGVADRRLSRPTRLLLCLAPVVFVIAWAGMEAWARAGTLAFGGESQLHRSDLSSSRFGIWKNTLDLIAAQPWSGVGWGEFNLAWTLTPFPGRPTAFFDHTHNLVLQLLVELGLPLGLLVLGLLLYALWRAAATALFAPAAEASMARSAAMMVLTMAVHSQFEYPLWYAYFLLPTAFAFGMVLGRGPADAQARSGTGRRLPTVVLVAGSAALVAGAMLAVVDYVRVVAIFSPPIGAASLEQRIADGQRSWFFAHHADYAAVTTVEHPSDAISGFRRAPHYLLDARLMMAWARALDESGQVERARYVAQRLQEFRNDQAESFFAPCEDSSVQDKPFQCQAPSMPFDYGDFR